MKQDSERRFDLEIRLLEYAARILKLCENLPRTLAGRHTAGHLLRSGTAPLSHHGEALAAESPEDFRHKLTIGLQELKESWRWLRLVEQADLISPNSKLAPLLEETAELIRIFSASIKTSQLKSNAHN